MSRSDIVDRLLRPLAPNRRIRDLFDEAAAEVTRGRAEYGALRRAHIEAVDAAVARQARLCLLLREARDVILRHMADTGHPEPAEIVRHIDATLEELS